jgi:hypothetical protein
MDQPTTSLHQPNLVFRRNDRWFFLYTAVLFAVAVLLGLVQGLDFPPIFWIYTSVLMIWVVGAGHLTRIEIAPTGITYHHFDVSTISSPWSNVEGIREITFRFGRQRRCVVLREPAQRDQQSVDWSIPRTYVGRVIPIDRFWANADVLEQQIRQHIDNEQPM